MSKFSAFPTSTTFTDAADIIVGLIGGADKKFTRSTFLTAQAGETVKLRNVSGTSSVGVRDDGNVYDVVASACEWAVIYNSAYYMRIDVSGNFEIVLPSGASYRVNAVATNVFFVDGTGNVTIQPVAGQTLTLGGFAGTSGYWSGDPTDVWSAIERIAAVVSAGGGTPIP